MRTKTMHNEWIRLITAGGLLGLAAIAPTEGWVTGLTKQEIGNGVQLTIVGKDLPKPRELRVRGGKGYVVEFDAGLEGGAKNLTIDSSGVSSAEAVWYRSKPPVVRVLVRLKADEKPVLAPCSNGYTVSINVPAAQRGKPSRSGTQVDPAFIQPMPVDATKAKAAKEAAAAAQRVSLDFVNTDVIQILKALALQADVNIVTAPEVQGRKITVSLDKITVNDALDFVTALAGLRYARVQDSYVVTTRDTFPDIMRDLVNRSPRQNVIRIVPIISGDGAGIKAALSQWFGPTSLEVLLPGEQQQKGAGSSAPASGAGTPTPTASAAGGTQTAPPPAQTPPSQPAPAGSANGGGENTPYLLLIGEQKWVSKAETMVHRLDEQVLSAKTMAKQAQRVEKHNEDEDDKRFAEAMLKGLPPQSKATYGVQNGVAEDLKKVVEASEKSAGVTIIASPPHSTVQTLVLSGPEDAVDSAMTMLRTLDTGAGASAEVVSYDIKYADPRSLREDLVANVPGLIVTNPPPSAATPRLYQKGQSALQQGQTQATSGQTGTGGTGTGQSQGQTGAAGATTAPGVSTSAGTFGTPDLPFDNEELSALPMRLILRGSDAQIQNAMSYLAKVDVAPKQVAIEMRVMELSKEDAMKLGIDWSILTGGTVKTISLNQSASGIGTNTSPANSITGHLGLNGNGSGSVTATLDAIANKNNLISRPNLLAIDGRESEIFVGDDIRYVESIVSSQTGPTIQSADIQVGVRLSVLARVGGDGNITMDMRPVVSFLKGFNSVNSIGVTLNLPQTSVRIAQSTVNVKSGETIAIGGLIQDQDILNVQKLPILGDLPILGQLFRTTTHDRTRSEIVFFLTVKEVTPSDRGDAADPRPMEKSNKGELPIPHRKILP
ncbi:MAG: type II secretion system protein GspD [Fimbriimonadaceae bacterium]